MNGTAGRGDAPPEAQLVALGRRVDGFSEDVRRRHRDDLGALSCRAGCAGCCHVDLSVTALEAAGIAAYLARTPESATAIRVALAARAPDDDRCAFLDDAGRCGIYEVRPLVCRTQGLPLRYPGGTVPEGRVTARGKRNDGAPDDDLVWCPLNFTDTSPTAADVLDAEHLDTVVGVLDLAFRRDRGMPETEPRVALRDLARGRDGAST